MFFQKKVDRVIDVKKAEKELEDREDEKLEGKDKIAMAIAAILVFVPALLLVLGIFLAVFPALPALKGRRKSIRISSQYDKVCGSMPSENPALRDSFFVNFA